MNAAETIQAAIQKLEELKAKASPTWELRGGNEWFYPWGIDVGHEDEATYVIPPSDAELIVTLHRTIDAQLAILRNAIGGAKDMDEHATPDEPDGTLSALVLARSILGVES